MVSSGLQSSASLQENEQRKPGKNDFVIRNGFPALLDSTSGGPLIEGTDPLPRYRFASFKNALDVLDAETLLRDCRTVFSARTRDDDAAYSSGQTYFCPCRMKPRCALEALALSIFQVHTQGLDGIYNPEQSGAEWWTLVLDAKKKASSTIDDETQKSGEVDHDDKEDDDDDEVGIHFDADYGLEAQAPDVLLHPRIATVTYLSNVGAPTLIFDKASPPPSDVDKQSLNGAIEKGWLSGPLFGKHIAFDGRLLHGAPALFFPGSDTNDTSPDGISKEPAAKRRRLEEDTTAVQPSKQRVTFLVNIWLNHCPLDAELLDDDIVESLEAGWSDDSSATRAFTSAAADDSSTAVARPSFEWKLSDVSTASDMLTTPIPLTLSSVDPAGSDEVVICDRLVTIEYGANMTDLHRASRQAADGESVHLHFSEGCIQLSVGEQVAADDEVNEASDGT